MGKKVKFTEEEIATLSQNPYTYRVTAYQMYPPNETMSFPGLSKVRK